MGRAGNPPANHGIAKVHDVQVHTVLYGWGHSFPCGELQPLAMASFLKAFHKTLEAVGAGAGDYRGWGWG